MKPLLHLWSLGVEEQFYLIWPIALLLTPRRFRLTLIVLVMIGSFALNVVLIGRYPDAVFYLPFTRVWELMAGAILLRAGRPILIAPATVGSPGLRRIVVAWKDTRECRRAVRDALPFLREAEHVVIVGIDEGQSDNAATLSDVAQYLLRHRVVAPREIWRRAQGPIGAELLRLVRDEGADLIVAGGYGRSRLGEWIFGGVTHELLTSSPVCCVLSH